MAQPTEFLRTNVVSSGPGSSYTLEYLSPSKNKKTGDQEIIVVPYLEMGRLDECAIQYGEENRTVSRRHAAIEKRGEQFFLINLSTSNPTFLNSQPITDHVLADGDKIQLSVNGPSLKFITAVGQTVASLSPAPVHTPPTGFTQKINMATQQAVKPYRTMVYGLLAALLVAVAIGGFFLWNQQRKIEESKSQLSQLEELRQKELEESRKKTEELANKLSEMKKDESTLISELNRTRSAIQRSKSNADHGINEGQNTVEMYQQLKKDIYFLEVRDISISANGKVIPVDMRWTGSAFLCSDGKLVTARHCIQGWRYSQDTTSVILNIVENKGAKINARYRVTSTNDRFEFDYSQVILDDSRDAAQEVKEFTLKFPTDAASDWAYVQTNRSSNLQYDKTLSTSLSAGENLYILGFSLAIGGPNDGEVKPLYSKSDVAQDGLSPAGLIMITNRNFEQGNSGGPVFVNRDGAYRCVGIISIARMDARGGFSSIGGIVPISMIR